MRVLIACECSGRVRDAFATRGHDAWSCDLQPSDTLGNHLQCDVMNVLGDGWDMMIAHPDCTYLAVSGLHWNGRVPGRAEKTETALEFVRTLMDANIPKIAIENPVGCISTRIRKPDQIIQPWQFGDNASKKTCLWLTGLPNLEVYYPAIIPPKGWQKVMSAADMVACECCDEPFCPECGTHYADCSCIGPTQDGATYKTIDGYMFASLDDKPPHPVWANQTPSGQNKLGPSPDRKKLRSITYQGIANAMAEQWGTT